MIVIEGSSTAVKAMRKAEHRWLDEAEPVKNKIKIVLGQ